MKVDISNLGTEQRNSNTYDIDRVSTLEMVAKINNEDKKVALAIEMELTNIAKAIDIVTDKIKNRGRLIYCGAGTSGRLGVLDASECPPTYGVSSELVQGLIAGGETALTKSVENSEDSKELGVRDLKSINFSKNDVLVGIAASGRTPYVIGAIEYAKAEGAFTIALACSKDSLIGKIAHLKIEPVVGAEVITGSTRMKSGSAQKMVLNMISTGVMIKLGKVYGNLMVDVQALNSKLVERCKKIFMDATKANYQEAENYLTKSNFNVKLAILMFETNLDAKEAKKNLDKYDGILFEAINNCK